MAQRQYLITLPPKQIAIDLDMDIRTLYRWRNGEQPVPSHQAFRLAYYQGDWRYLHTLAKQFCERMDLPLPKRLTHSTILLLTEMMKEFETMLRVANKVQRKEKFSKKEVDKFRQSVEKLKRCADEMLQRAMDAVEEDEPKGNGKGKE